MNEDQMWEQLKRLDKWVPRIVFLALLLGAILGATGVLVVTQWR